MKIPCSSCNQRLEIPEELAGQTIECPACKASLAVPSLAAPPPPTPRVEVTTPQASAPQKPAPQRKTAAQPKAASSKKSKSPIPKWAIAAIAGLLVVGILIFSSGQSGPSVLESYTGVLVSPSGNKMALDLELRSDNSFVLRDRPLSKNISGGNEYVGTWKRNTKDLILEGKSGGQDDFGLGEFANMSVILKIDKKTMKLKSWITEGEETIENQSSKPITFKRK